jgi:hypothetical protein
MLKRHRTCNVAELHKESIKKKSVEKRENKEAHYKYQIVRVRREVKSFALK